MNRLLPYLQSVLLSGPVQHTQNLWKLFLEFSSLHLSPNDIEKNNFSKQFLIFQFQRKTNIALTLQVVQFPFSEKIKIKCLIG